MGAGGAAEPRGAVEVVVDGRDRGEPGEALGREREHDELAAERELLAERVASGVEVVGEQRGEPGVARSSIHR